MGNVYYYDFEDNAIVVTIDTQPALMQLGENKDEGIFPKGDVLSVTTSGAPRVTASWTSSSSEAPYVRVVSNELIFNGYAVPFGADRNYLNTRYDCSLYVGGSIHDSFVVRTTLYVYAGTITSNRLLAEYGTLILNYSFPKLNFSWYDSDKVTDADIQNQTNSINNNITQQTQQQTNTLTGGYDDAGMEDSNAALSGSINDYDQKESQITDQATSFIDGVEFIDLSSQVQLLTGITFASSFLQSLFVSLGDWGILVVFSLSITLAFMLIGWFKFRR